MNDHYPIHHGLVSVSLGALRREYAPIFTAGANDLEVTRGVLMRPPIILEQEYPWFEKPADEKNIIFAILLHEKNEESTVTEYRYIGHTGIHGVTWPNGCATTGSLIIDKACFGKGYGTEAKLLLLYEAFRNRGLHKVTSHVKAFNSNSWGHLIACGYREVGRHEAHHFSDGVFVDEIIFDDIS